MMKCSRQLQLLFRGSAHSNQGAFVSTLNSVFKICAHNNLQNNSSHFQNPKNFSTTLNKCVRGKSKEGDDGSKQKKLDPKEMLENAASFDDIDTVGGERGWSTSPYPQGTERIKRQSQASYSMRPNVDPRLTSILMFPGQGTQFVGMGKKLMKFPVARDLFEYANEILKYDLLKLCLEGPIEELSKTVHSQPAIFVCSLAAVERLKEERPSAIENCMAAAGYSLGEITALTFAGALTFERALMLVKVRAEAMQLASEIAPGGMATVYFSPDHKLKTALVKAREWCIEKGIENPVCSVTSYLYPDCKVVGGHNEALKYLEANKALYGIRRVHRLNVNGAFHTELMRPAVEPFKKALKSAGLSDPVISVHSNVDGKRYHNASHVHSMLPQQIYKPIKWEQTLHILYERPVGSHFPRTFECGPGETLKSILKLVNLQAGLSCTCIGA